MELPIMDEAWFNSLPAVCATRKVDLDAFFVLQDVNPKLIKRKGKGCPTAILSNNVYAAAPPSTWGNARLAALHLQTYEPPSLPLSTISQWFKAVLDNRVPRIPETAEPDMTSPTLTRKQRRKQARSCYKKNILLQRKHGIWNYYPF
jgi:hypothetical protein